MVITVPLSRVVRTVSVLGVVLTKGTLIGWLLILKESMTHSILPVLLVVNEKVVLLLLKVKVCPGVTFLYLRYGSLVAP
jgi:hypothetical protein